VRYETSIDRNPAMNTWLNGVPFAELTRGQHLRHVVQEARASVVSHRMRLPVDGDYQRRVLLPTTHQPTARALAGATMRWRQARICWHFPSSIGKACMCTNGWHARALRLNRGRVIDAQHPSPPRAETLDVDGRPCAERSSKRNGALQRLKDGYSTDGVCALGASSIRLNHSSRGRYALSATSAR
jgi:hypothetical protein